MWRKAPKSPKSQISRVTSQVTYPADSAVETEDGVYFILKNGTKMKLYSERVVESWAFNLLPGSTSSLSNHKKAPGVLGFRNGTLIQNIADGKIYLVSNNLRRHIQSPDVFTRFGLDRSKVIEVSQEEINIHGEGEVLS